MILVDTKIGRVAAMLTNNGLASKTSIPARFQDLCQQATESCALPEQQKQIFQLLKKYGELFTQGDNDMGVTNLI